MRRVAKASAVTANQKGYKLDDLGSGGVSDSRCFSLSLSFSLPFSLTPWSRSLSLSLPHLTCICVLP